ncbi:MAG: hypothetical protein L0H96_09535 [Humibacillus sp.]|nr:hypothetical protein [Humibacillus sp.]MDN5777140.1 hypothetical protein [Humibacillus sp.]
MERITRTYVRGVTALNAIQHRPDPASDPETDPDAGLTTVEWGLLTGGVALVAIAAVATFGTKVAALMGKIPGGG